MILLTGSSGFIGSNVAASCKAKSIDVLPCEREDTKDLDKFFYSLRKYVPDSTKPIDAVIHLGAISDTTAGNVEQLLHNNYVFSLALLDWCTDFKVPFIWASSAATYGDGSQGFSDDLETLPNLKPLNLYALSKHLFDLAVVQRASKPPQWVGLKLFNVYGPGEAHKGKQASLISQQFDAIQHGLPARLFDEAACRDFVYIDNVVSVIMWMIERRDVSGIFNVGTGEAKEFHELLGGTFAALGLPHRINLVRMPASLRSQYQFYTCADISRLRAAGYDKPFLGIEEGVRRYVAWLKENT